MQEYNDKTIVNISNSTFKNNKASTGGAISINGFGSYVQTNIIDSNFIGNESDYTGGAINYQYGKDFSINGILNITNTLLESNKSTGIYENNVYSRGGRGGAIFLSDLNKYKELLNTEDVIFKNNKSLFPFYWDYNDDSSTDLEKLYDEIIVNTQYSQVDMNVSKIERTNIFNGDDVYFSPDSTVTIDLNPNKMDELMIENYSVDSFYFYALDNQRVSKVLTPIASGYKFMGFVDENNQIFDFDNTLISKDITLSAVWEKVITYTVTYTDGVEDEVIFEDREFVLEAGMPTPEFDTSEINREGYVFTGWSPSINNFVEENIVYTATWQKKSLNTSNIIVSYVDTEGNKLANDKFILAKWERIMKLK